MKRVFFVVVISFLCGLTCFAEAVPVESGNVFIEALKKPLESIFSPITGGGFVDLIFMPVEKVIDMSKVVFTPSRTKEYVYNINKNISVITLEDIERSNSTCLQDLLKRKAGIVLNGYFGNVKDSNLDIRGFGAKGLLNYLLLIDGRRTNQTDISGADLGQIDLNFIERIEITRGPNTVMYGDNATGGIINIITKKASEKDKIEFIQKFGSFQAIKEYVSVSGSHPFMDYFVSYSFQDTEGYRLNNGYEANDFFANFTVKPEEYLDVFLSANYHKDWYGFPGAMYLINIENDGREGSRFPDDKSKTEDYCFTVEPRIYGELGQHEGVFSSLFSFRSRRVNSRSFGLYENDHYITSFDIRPKVEINSSFLDESLENKIVFGTDYYFSKDRILSGNITYTKSRLDIVKETFGVYVEDSMLINKRFIINAGIRGDWAEYSFDQTEPAASYDTQSLREVAFDTGLGFKYNEKSQIYGNFARSFRYPATDQFFQSAYEFYDWKKSVIAVNAASLNTNLKAQRGDSYEIGIKDNSFDFLSTNAAYYYMDMRNEMYYDIDLYANMNYPHTIHHGFELEAQMNIFDELQLLFAYNFQKAYFEGGKYDGNTIPLVPENKFSVGVDLYPLEGFGINLAMNYLGSRYIINDQVNEAPKLKEHLTLDLNLTYETEHYKIFGSIKNLLGGKYHSIAVKDWAGNEAFYPAASRTFEVGFVIIF